MLFKIIIYSTSTGMLRAVTFLASIVLSKSYEMSVVGEYALMQTISQLLLPLLTLNVTVALTREAKANPHGAVKLIRYVWTGASLVAGVTILLGLSFKGQYWWLFGLALGSSEAIFACGNSFFLGKEHSKRILIMGMIKIVGFLVLIGLAFLHFIDMYTLTLCMVVQSYILAAYFVLQAIKSVPNAPAEYTEDISPSVMLMYSLATLPHTIALWISVSSDRLVLGSLIGKEAVAQYVMSYTISQSVMVVVSGVVSAMPPDIINNPGIWRKPLHIKNFFTNLAKVCLLVTFLNLAYVYVDRKYLGIIPTLSEQSYLHVGLISAGFFFSVLYVFFASYLYLNRETDILKTAGVILVPINLLVLYIVVSLWGQVGAAAGLAFTYLSFGIAYGRAAMSIEKVLGDIWRKIFIIFGLFIIVVMCFAFSARMIDAYDWTHMRRTGV